MSDSTTANKKDDVSSLQPGGSMDLDSSATSGLHFRSCAKRTRSDGLENNEPLLKRSAFRLQPATLIHGQTRVASRRSDNNEPVVVESSKCKFLQPSKLQVSSVAVAAVRNEPSSDQLCGKTTSGHVSSHSNPFLTKVEKDEEDKRNNDEDETNKCSNIKDSDRDFPSANTAKSSNVPSSNVQHSVKAPGFVFGQNLSERAKVDNTAEVEQVESVKTSPSFTQLESNKNEEQPADSETEVNGKASKRLEEDAAAHFAASQSRAAIPEVEVITGEENEKNVLQVQCKLYQFDTKAQTWKERGVGSLHLNDCKMTDDAHFQSRLVMRTNGSMRLVLNTKVWSQMSVDRASKKSIRITAQTENGEIGVYLISATINDTEQIYRAIEYRVLHQKRLKEIAQRSRQQQHKPHDRADDDNTTTVAESSGGENIVANRKALSEAPVLAPSPAAAELVPRDEAQTTTNIIKGVPPDDDDDLESSADGETSTNSHLAS